VLQPLKKVGLKMIEIERFKGNLNKYLIETNKNKVGNFLGTQHIFSFNNGFGASVINYGYGRGDEIFKYELAVVRFLEKNRFEIVTNTKITDDVLGHISAKKVASTLRRIKRLTN
jgi:hypothetical protein